MLRSAKRLVLLALQPGGWALTVAATLGPSAATVVAFFRGSPTLAAAVLLGCFVILLFIAGVRLDRELDARPTLDIRYEPQHTYSSEYHEAVMYGGQARFCSVWVTTDKEAQACYGRIVSCEHRDSEAFVPFDRFMGAVELGWPKHPMEELLDVEPDVPERLVVCMGIKDDDRVHLGTSQALGSAINLPAGEYRVKVRVGCRGWGTRPDRPTERWFRVKNPGPWDRVELLPDEEQP